MIIRNTKRQVVVNWHLLEQCNYRCHYCFAKYGKPKSLAKDANEAKKIIQELRKLDAGKGVRLNFAGGEPFLLKNLGELIKYTYDIGLEVSFISNGSRITDNFIDKYASYISMAGISIDAPDEETSRKIGRAGKRTGKTISLERIKNICEKFKQINPSIKIKINTVVCNENKNCDMHSVIDCLNPNRWKVFRVLPTKKEIKPITDIEFQNFIERHKDIKNMVVEDNDDMTASYLMIDPLGRFYDNKRNIHNGEQDYNYSASILEVGIEAALKQINFNPETYNKRYEA